jgi:anti-sigma B factor antagonist
MNLLEVEAQRRGRVVTVVPHGEVDVYSSPTLREYMLHATSDGAAKIFVDLRDVTFIDGTGLEILVTSLKRATANHASLELICADAHILKILRLAGLSNAFKIYSYPPFEHPTLTMQEFPD